MTDVGTMMKRLVLAFVVSGLALPVAVVAQARDIMVQIAPDPVASKISVVVTPNLSHTRLLPGKALQQARKDMLADIMVSDDDLRALGVRNDGLAAQKLVERLVANGAGNHVSDIAYFGCIAASTGRIKSLRPAIEAMRQLDPVTEPAERIRICAAMLYAHAWAGNPLALDAVMDLNGDGKLFGPLSEKTRAKIIAEGEKAGDGRVALRLAVRLMDRQDAALADLEQARAYLTQAAAGNNFAAQTLAANLLVTLNGRMASQ